MTTDSFLFSLVRNTWRSYVTLVTGVVWKLKVDDYPREEEWETGEREKEGEREYTIRNLYFLE